MTTTQTTVGRHRVAIVGCGWNSPQGPEPDATGYKGFYYHFLDMETGRRAGQCELSTVDSAFLLASSAHTTPDSRRTPVMRSRANGSGEILRSFSEGG
jgi:hypothetical protein